MAQRVVGGGAGARLRDPVLRDPLVGPKSPAMLTQQDIEVAYWSSRAATSATLALASTDRCARAAHLGFAKAYRHRLETLRVPVTRCE